MGKVARDHHRSRLEKLLGHCEDEPTIRMISAATAMLGGHAKARHLFRDAPADAVGAKLGSPFHISPWTLETLVNELLSAPKHRMLGRPQFPSLRYDLYDALQLLATRTIALEGAEDAIFLENHDVMTEMHRIAQRQFPWQRGVGNLPNLYRSMRFFGSGRAAHHFEASAGIPVETFVKIGMWLAGSFTDGDLVKRDTDLTPLGVSPEQRERALALLSISHADARTLARRVRAGSLHTAYRRSILRDHPIIAFGDQDERLRCPLPALVTHRWTAGLYLDVVKGGIEVWKEVGEKFERYCFEYLSAMMGPLSVYPELTYGPKKARWRTPDILVGDGDEIVLVAECKAKRMSFEARFADDPVAEAAAGYGEIAKGVFQIWRLFSHARRGVAGLPPVRADCLGIVLTLDSWLSLARNQEAEVVAAANALADAEGDIAAEDRRHVAVCEIADVEYALQHGNAETFLEACRALGGEKKGWGISIAHLSFAGAERPYPFKGRVADVLPWWRPSGDA